MQDQDNTVILKSRNFFKNQPKKEKPGQEKPKKSFKSFKDRKKEKEASTTEKENEPLNNQPAIPSSAFLNSFETIDKSL